MPRNPERFMGWSHNPRPIEMIRARPILETATRVNALLRGDIDATDSYLPTDREGYPFDLEQARAACDRARAEGAPVNREIEIHIQSSSRRPPRRPSCSSPTCGGSASP